MPAGPSEEAGAAQAPRPAQLGGQGPADAAGAQPGALGSLHSPAQAPVQLLQLLQLQAQAALVALGPGGTFCPPGTRRDIEGDPGQGWG